MRRSASLDSCPASRAMPSDEEIAVFDLALEAPALRTNERVVRAAPWSDTIAVRTPPLADEVSVVRCRHESRDGTFRHSHFLRLGSFSFSARAHRKSRSDRWSL